MSEKSKGVTFCGLTPILNVKDVPASIEYYVSKLGFNKNWDWPCDGPRTFAAVGRGEISIFLCQGGQGQSGTWMSVFVDDTDALHEEYKASGAKIMDPPADCPWGMREMRVTDLDEHVIRFGHSIEQADKPVCRDEE